MMGYIQSGMTQNIYRILVRTFHKRKPIWRQKWILEDSIKVDSRETYSANGKYEDITQNHNLVFAIPLLELEDQCHLHFSFKSIMVRATLPAICFMSEYFVIVTRFIVSSNL